MENKSKLPAILIVILILIAGAGGYFYYKYTQTVKQMNGIEENLTVVKQEKEKMILELDSLENEVKAQMGQSQQLDAQLLEKVAEIEQLRVNLERANMSAAQVGQYKKQVEVLTLQVQQYIRENAQLKHAADSLEYVSAAQKMKIDTLQITDFQKTQRLDDLSKKVEMGAELRIADFKAVAYNIKGKPIIKASRVKRIGVSGVVLKNVLSSAGNKTVYLRITSPSGIVITQSNDNQFEFENKTVMYSDKKEINYDNSDTKVDIYYNIGEGIIDAGVYQIAVFCDGKEIGNGQLALK